MESSTYDVRQPFPETTVRLALRPFLYRLCHEQGATKEFPTTTLDTVLEPLLGYEKQWECSGAISQVCPTIRYLGSS